MEDIRRKFNPIVDFSKFTSIKKILNEVVTLVYVWANFALGSNSVKGKARPNILYEEIRTSEEDQPMNGRNYHPRRGAAC